MEAFNSHIKICKFFSTSMGLWSHQSKLKQNLIVIFVWLTLTSFLIPQVNLRFRIIHFCAIYMSNFDLKFNNSSVTQKLYWSAFYFCFMNFRILSNIFLNILSSLCYFSLFFKKKQSIILILLNQWILQILQIGKTFFAHSWQMFKILNFFFWNFQFWKIIDYFMFISFWR